MSRWRFHDNGTIRPRFGFDAVQDTCVCNVHHHHVYWRFDFDIGGANNEVREFNPAHLPPDNWHTFQFEARRRKRPDLSRRWQIRNPADRRRLRPDPRRERQVADTFARGTCGSCGST